MKVLHVLERSAPELVGYTVRGSSILNHQRRLGLDPVVVTSPFFRNTTGTSTDVIEGIRHHRSNHIPRPDKAQGRLAGYWTRMHMARRYREYVTEIARQERPDVIHAHSSYLNGIAASYASKRLGVPFIYELRGLWADTAVVEDGLRQGSLKYRTFWQLELGVVRRANMVVAISQGIRDAIVRRGIDPDRIAIVPNGVDTDVFAPRPVDVSLKQTLGLDGCFVVGFIGSVRRLEGLDQVIEAFKEVHRSAPHARVLIVGEGTDTKRLAGLAAAAGLSEVVRFTGLVPYDQILRYYSIMDVLAYPRIDAPINQMVTPLKPLEAMAMGKVCLASDVGGLKELIEDGVTGLLFAAGEVREVTEKILRLASDKGLRDRLSAQAQSTVRREREWSTLAMRYVDIYHRAGALEARQLVSNH
jgi:glycogen(starch) synthase